MPNGMPDIHTGTLVEVLTVDNHLSFLGRVISYTGDMIAIQDAQGRELVPAVYNRDIKMRLMQNGTSLIIQGKICGCTKQFWRIDRLQKNAVSEKREYFRQVMHTKAKVQCLKRSAVAPKLSRGMSPSPCSVLDVSAGGMMIRCQEPFQLGDRLLVSDVRIADEAPFRFTCYVQRVENVMGREAMFGCQFEPMEQREEDRLLRALFSVQRQEIQKSRG